MKKLSLEFYDRKDVLLIAKELLGKIVVTKIGNEITSGRIVETEAYVGLVDKASHSFGGNRTTRNEHMYCKPATSYIYICYGIHQMLNVVTNKKDIPDAVLIRALDPIKGIDTMLKRTGKSKPDYSITKGPGNVGKALGLNKQFSGMDLRGNDVSIYQDAKSIILDPLIGSSKRIGVESAGADGLLPYRFYVKGNKYVSGSPVI